MATMTRVFKYGLKPPCLLAERVSDQIWLGHQYQNALVEIERGHRAAFREGRLALAPDLADLEAAATTLSGEIEKIDAATRGVRALQKNGKAPWWMARNEYGSFSATERRALKKKTSGDRREVRKKIKKIKTDMKASGSLDELSARLNAERTAQVKVLRAEYTNDKGLPWGTYLLREEAHKAASSGASDPKFKRWDGNGYVGVQCQRSGIDKQLGFATADLASDRSTMVQVRGRVRSRNGKESIWADEPLPSHQWDSRPGRRSAYTKLRLRVGSNKRKPIWAEWGMLQHRPFPRGARVKRVRVNRKMVGRREEWSVDFTIVVDAESLRAPRQATGGACGIDIGWRRLDDGRLRIAVLRDDDGKYSEHFLPPSVEGRLQKATDIASIRDKMFNAIRPQIAEFWRGRDMPQAMRRIIVRKASPTASVSGREVDGSEQRQLDGQSRDLLRRRDASSTTKVETHIDGYIGRILSKKRMQRLIEAWRDSGVHTHRDAFGKAEYWYHRDRHLQDYECGARTRALRTRKEHYRLFAQSIAAAYHRVGLEAIDWGDLSRRAEPEDRGSELPRPARWLRVVTAPGMLAEMIRKAAADPVDVKAAHTTQMGSCCGHINEFDNPATLWQTCDGCSAAWDQDFNAALNILRAVKASSTS